MKKFLVLWICFVCSAGLLVQSAEAYPQFRKQFLKKYAGKDVDPKVAKTVKDASCNACHGPKKGPDGKPDRKDRNAYGKQLAKLLTPKDKSKKKIEKVQAALEEVGKIKSDPSDENSPTYGELLEQGKLPFVLTSKSS